MICRPAPKYGWEKSKRSSRSLVTLMAVAATSALPVATAPSMALTLSTSTNSVFHPFWAAMRSHSSMVRPE